MKTNLTVRICPCCGSPRRFFEELGMEMKKRGLAGEDKVFSLDAKQGIMMDDSKKRIIPVGITIPGFDIKSDICAECGCMYATELHMIEGKTIAAPLDLQKGAPNTKNN